MAEFKLRRGQGRVEADNLLILFAGSLYMVGLGERARVIQMGANVFRLQGGGLLQVFQRRLRLFLVQQQNPQVQARGKKIRGKLQSLLVGFRRIIRLVETRVGITQVGPHLRDVRFCGDDRFQRLHRLGKILSRERLIRGAQQAGKFLGFGRGGRMRGGIAQFLE